MVARRRTRVPEEATVEKGKLSINVKRVKSKMILSEDQREEEFDSEVFETEPAYIRVAHGVTKNIGEYESLRCDVSISMPCYKERIDETIALVGEKVAQKLEQELAEWGLSVYEPQA